MYYPLDVPSSWCKNLLHVSIIFSIISTTFPISEKKVFVLRGGSIVLQAKQVTRISSIIWKHNKDKAAEWFEGDDAPNYYIKFKSVATLDTQTWTLNISNLQTHFSGKYSAEVNNKDPTQFVTLTVLGECYWKRFLLKDVFNRTKVLV